MEERAEFIACYCEEEGNKGAANWGMPAAVKLYHGHWLDGAVI